MPRKSAGLLMYRRGEEIEVFLVHPGGPFWARKEQGTWTIPKGGCEGNEEAIAAARREFQEETGFIAHGPFLNLGVVQQSSGKLVHAWTFEGDCDPAMLVSNLCEVEWPPCSGKHIQVPEVDRGAWFSLGEAKERILKGQQPLLDRLGELIKGEIKERPGPAE